MTTLQKFPQIVDAVEEMSDRKFALVIDEAHSSQGGENAQAVGEVLAWMATQSKTQPMRT